MKEVLYMDNINEYLKLVIDKKPVLFRCIRLDLWSFLYQKDDYVLEDEIKFFKNLNQHIDTDFKTRSLSVCRYLESTNRHVSYVLNHQKFDTEGHISGFTKEFKEGQLVKPSTPTSDFIRIKKTENVKIFIEPLSDSDITVVSKDELVNV